MQDQAGDALVTTVASAIARGISAMPTVDNDDDQLLPCSLVNNLAKNTHEQCKFVVDNECLEDEATVDYVYMVFCRIDYELRLLAIALVILLVIVLFLNLSAVADEFLCPSLLTVAKNLRMSDSLAGVTLLAFGNGCPDIFASLAAASSGRPELIVGELLGAGIFCTSIVAGLIFISAEFKIARRPLLRDTSFYLLAIYLIWLFCSQGRVTFYGALAFILIYVIYLLTALLGQAVHSRLRGEYPIADESHTSEGATTTTTTATMATSALCDIDDTTEKEMIYRRLEELIRRRSSGVLDVKQLVSSAGCKRDQASQDAKNDEPQLNMVTTIQISAKSDRECPTTIFHKHKEVMNQQTGCREQNDNNVIEIATSQLNSCNQMATEMSVKGAQFKPVSSDKAKLELSELKLTPVGLDKALHGHLANPTQFDSQNIRFNLDEFDHFLLQINPIDTIDWSKSRLMIKVMSLIRAPLLLLTILTVPVVDNEKPNRNWCRLLNSIHCFTIPVGVLALTNLLGSGSNWWWFWFTSASTQLNDDDDNEGLRKATVNNNNSFGVDRLVVGTSQDLPLDFDDALITCSKLLVFAPGLVLALYVFNTTSASRPPRYHSLFAYLGFIMSILWIYKLANEIISLLKTIGIIFSMSDTAIGLGFLAWGNSLGDIVANLTLAQAGYARMALGASIGAPLLNLLLGFGFAFTVSLKPGEAAAIEYNTTMTLLASTLALVLVLLMASTMLPQNQSKKPFGYLLIGCYLLYFSLAVCFEYELL